MHLLILASVFANFAYSFFFNTKLFYLQFALIGSYLLLHVIFRFKYRGLCSNKLSSTLWGEPTSPTRYYTLDVNTEKIDLFIKDFHIKHNFQITYTHFFMKLVATALTKNKNINGKNIFGKFIPSENVNINTIIDIDGKYLTGAVVEDCQKKTILEIRNDINSKVKKIKKNKDPEVKKQINDSKKLFTFLIHLLLRLSITLSYYFSLDSKLMQLRKEFFGSIVITNVSKMNLYNTFSCLSYLAPVVMLVVINKPKKKVVIDENMKIVTRSIAKLKISFDSRFDDEFALKSQTLCKDILELATNPVDIKLE